MTSTRLVSKNDGAGWFFVRYRVLYVGGARPGGSWRPADDIGGLWDAASRRESSSAAASLSDLRKSASFSPRVRRSSSCSPLRARLRDPSSARRSDPLDDGARRGFLIAGARRGEATRSTTERGEAKTVVDDALGEAKLPFLTTTRGQDPDFGPRALLGKKPKNPSPRRASARP